jgi:4-hydroxy 2-oxovalerate aldolase
MSDKAPWITFRPELKVLDCTVRDGGLVNAHQFSDEFVRAVYQACVEAGIDYMEIGYKNSPRIFPKEKFGPWRHCDEADLKRVVGDHDAEKTGLKLAAMADAGKSDWETQIVPAAESPLSMIRVAFYAHQVSEAVDMIRHAHELGYETTANLMAVSNITEEEIDTVLESIAPTPATTMVIVDSFGYLYREQIDRLYRKYSTALEGTGKEIGIHAHNNLQLAFANTIEAIILGCNRVDATMYGFGRGRGQLSHRAAARVPAQSQVRGAPGHRGDPEVPVPLAPTARLGSVDPLQPHRPAQPAPAQCHRVARGADPGRLPGLLRQTCSGDLSHGQ